MCSNKMNVLYVTAFKDIGRSKWKFFQCPNDAYIGGIQHLGMCCPKVVAFVDEDVKNFRGVVHPYRSEDTYLGTCIPKEEGA